MTQDDLASRGVQNKLPPRPGPCPRCQTHGYINETTGNPWPRGEPIVWFDEKDVAYKLMEVTSNHPRTIDTKWVNYLWLLIKNQEKTTSKDVAWLAYRDKRLCAGEPRAHADRIVFWRHLEGQRTSSKYGVGEYFRFYYGLKVLHGLKMIHYRGSQNIRNLKAVEEQEQLDVK